jgi:small neutral amino acid transporter SnatA (MarC family)
MLGCLVSFLVAVLVAILVLWALEFGLRALGVPVPANIIMVLRVIVGLILLILALQCIVPGIGHGMGFRLCGPT